MSLEDKFNESSLDINNKTPLGGPNRTNSTNVKPIYDLPKVGYLYGQTQAPQGGPLTNKEGKIVNFKLHQYTSKNGEKYLDQFQPPQIPLNDPNFNSPTPTLSDLVKNAEKIVKQNGNI